MFIKLVKNSLSYAAFGIACWLGPVSEIPLEEIAGGDQACTRGCVGQFPRLPPVGVSLVHNFQDVSLLECHAGFGTGDGRVLLGAVVSHGSHIQLQGTEEIKRYRALCFILK